MPAGKTIYLKMAETGATEMPYCEVRGITLPGSANDLEQSDNPLIGGARVCSQDVGGQNTPYIDIDCSTLDINFMNNVIPNHVTRIIFRAWDYPFTRTLMARWEPSTNNAMWKYEITPERKLYFTQSLDGVTPNGYGRELPYPIFEPGQWTELVINAAFQVGGTTHGASVNGVWMPGSLPLGGAYNFPTTKDLTFFNTKEHDQRAYELEIDQIEMWEYPYTRSPARKWHYFTGGWVEGKMTSPRDNSYQQDYRTDISIEARAFYGNVDMTKTKIYVDETLAYDGGAGGFQTGFQGTNSVVTENSLDSYDIVIDSDPELPVNAVIDVVCYFESTVGEMTWETFQFRTADKVFPFLGSTNPIDGEIGVLVEDDIFFYIDAGTDVFDPATLSVDIGPTGSQVNAYSAGSFQNGFTGTVTDDGSGNVVIQCTFVKPADFAYGTEISVSVYAETTLLPEILDVTYAFDTEVELLPYLGNQAPAESADAHANTNVAFTIVAVSEDVDLATVVVTVNGTIAYQSSAFQNSFTGTVTPNGGGFDFDIDPPANFAFASSPLVAVYAQSVVGGVLDTSYSFNVLAEELPSVSNQDPADAETRVGVDATINFRLNGGSDFIDKDTIVVTVGGVIAYQLQAFVNGFGGTVTETNTVLGSYLDFSITHDTWYPLIGVSVRVEATNLLARSIDVTHSFTVGPGAVHMWPWVEPGATLYNDVIGSAHGTLVAGATLVKDGGLKRHVIGGSPAQLAAYLGYGEPSETNFGSTDFMIECRVKQVDLGQYELLYPGLWERENGSDGPNIYFRTDYLQRWHFLLRYGGTYAQSIWDNQSAPDWTHFIFRKQGTTLDMFRNGVKYVGVTTAPVTVPDLTGIEAFSFGAQFLRYFEVDYIAIWRGAMDDAEVPGYFANLGAVGVDSPNLTEFPVGGPLTLNISSSAGDIIQSTIRLTLNGLLVYDGGSWHVDYATSTIAADGSGGFDIDVRSPTIVHESYPYTVEIQCRDDADNVIDRVFDASTQRVIAVENSGFEAPGQEDEARYWTFEGLDPMSDGGVDSGIVAPGAFWTPPEGSKIDVPTTKDPASLLGHVRQTADQVIATTPPTSGLVARFSMDDSAADTVVTESVGGYNGALQGGNNTEDVSADGEYGTALYLNYSPNYIRVPHNVAFDVANITISAWVSLVNFRSNGYVICHPYSTSWVAPFFSWRMWTDDAGTRYPRCSVTVGGVAYDVPRPTDKKIDKNGVWHHLATTYDGLTLRLYTDGVEVSSVVCGAGGPIDYAGGPADLSIGQQSPYSTGNWLQGRVDDLLIYDRALDPAEILTLSRRLSGSMTKLAWASNIVPGSVAVKADGAPWAQDDGRGCVYVEDSLHGREYLHYKMEENAADTVVSDSSHNFDATVDNGHTTADLSAVGKIGLGFGFNGLDTRIHTDADLPALYGEWTFSFWYYPVLDQDIGGGGASGILMRLGDATDFIQLFHYEATSPSRLYYNLAGLQSYINNSTEDTWHHIALKSVPGTGIQIWRNGSLVATQSWFLAFPAQTLYIGASYNNTGFFHGTIDDFRFHLWGLTEPEIAEIWREGVGTHDALVRTPPGRAVGGIDYFDGSYEIKGPAGATGPLPATIDYDDRVPSYHRTRASAQLLDPRLFSFLSFYRKIEVPASPPLPAGTVFEHEVLFDDQVMWSESYGAGDEGSSVDGRQVVLLDPLSSDPRIVNRTRMRTGIDDAQSFDGDGAFVEGFGKFGPTQAEPVRLDEKQTFNESADEEEIFDWVVYQDDPTTIVLDDAMDWLDAPIVGPGTVPEPPRNVGITNAAGIPPAVDYPPVINTLGYVHYDEEYAYIRWQPHYNEIYIAGMRFGDFIFTFYRCGSSTCAGVWEFDASGTSAGDQGGYGGTFLAGGVTFPFFAATDTTVAQVMGIKCYGTPEAWELWFYHTTGRKDNLYTVAHWCWTAQEPLILRSLPGIDPQSGLPYGGGETTLSAVPSFPGNGISLIGINNDPADTPPYRVVWYTPRTVF